MPKEKKMMDIERKFKKWLSGQSILLNMFVVSNFTPNGEV